MGGGSLVSRETATNRYLQGDGGNSVQVFKVVCLGQQEYEPPRKISLADLYDQFKIWDALDNLLTAKERLKTNTTCTGCNFYVLWNDEEESWASEEAATANMLSIIEEEEPTKLLLWFLNWGPELMNLRTTCNAFNFISVANSASV